jgi:hypothetical protein
MSDDAEKATILKHADGSESEAWNEYIGSQASASIRPSIGDEEKRDKMGGATRARGYFPPEGFYDATPGAFGAHCLAKFLAKLGIASLPCNF